jgi:inner membrane protein YidH
VEDQSTPASQWIGGNEANELSSQRTAMAFERTALATDRTLMAVVRTSLALIGFGFTIYTFFEKMQEEIIKHGFAPEAPRRFGLALISLGVILLGLGIFNHVQEAAGRRARRQRLFDLGLLHSAEPLRVNSSMVIAILLLIVGLFAILRVAAHLGPF